MEKLADNKELKEGENRLKTILSFFSAMFFVMLFPKLAKSFSYIINFWFFCFIFGSLFGVVLFFINKKKDRRFGLNDFLKQSVFLIIVLLILYNVFNLWD